MIKREIIQKFITSASRLDLSPKFPVHLIWGAESLSTASKALNFRFFDYPEDDDKKCYVLHLEFPENPKFKWSSDEDVLNELLYLWAELFWLIQDGKHSCAYVCTSDGSIWTTGLFHAFFDKGRIDRQEFEERCRLGFYHELEVLPDLQPNGSIMVNFMI